MDINKYQISLEEIGYEQNRGALNDLSPNRLCLNKRYRVFTQAGDRILCAVFDFRNHEKNEIVIHLFNEQSGKYINAEVISNVPEVQNVIAMAKADTVTVTYGN